MINNNNDKSKVKVGTTVIWNQNKLHKKLF